MAKLYFQNAVAAATKKHAEVIKVKEAYLIVSSVISAGELAYNQLDATSQSQFHGFGGYINEYLSAVKNDASHHVFSTSFDYSSCDTNATNTGGTAFECKLGANNFDFTSLTSNMATIKAKMLPSLESHMSAYYADVLGQDTSNTFTNNALKTEFVDLCKNSVSQHHDVYCGDDFIGYVTDFLGY